MISDLPDTASLTLRSAIETCPNGWRHFVERCFQAAVSTGVPFRISAIRVRDGQLQFGVVFDQTNWKDRSQDEKDHLDYAFRLIIDNERQSGYTCEMCGRYGMRWAADKKIFVVCRRCSAEAFKSIAGACVIDSAPWERGPTRTGPRAVKPDYY